MNMSGENDGLGGSVSSAASMTCCVFFAVIYDAGDYSILSAYRACRDARRRVETGVSPTPEGGCGGHPPHIRAYTRKRFFAYQPQATRRREPPPMPSAHCRLPIRRHAVLRYGARSLTYLMYCSLPRAFHASPTEKYTALTHIRAYTRNRFFAYQPQATRRRKPSPMPFAHCRLPIRRHAVLRYGARSDSLVWI